MWVLSPCATNSPAQIVAQEKRVPQRAYSVYPLLVRISLSDFHRNAGWRARSVVLPAGITDWPRPGRKKPKLAPARVETLQKPPLESIRPPISQALKFGDIGKFLRETSKNPTLNRVVYLLPANSAPGRMAARVRQVRVRYRRRTRQPGSSGVAIAAREPT